jgi:hypothetical protein
MVDDVGGHISLGAVTFILLRALRQDTEEIPCNKFVYPAPHPGAHRKNALAGCRDSKRRV